MRVRRFELRLIAVALLAAWTLAASLVLLAYRPGGPLDLAVGLTMAAPIGIALSAVVWPPIARGSGAFPLMVALGVGSLLVLLPSIGGVLNQLLALGSQTLLPSLEAAYPWSLALAGTSLFAAFGLVRRLDGGMAVRRRRLIAGLAVGAGMTVTAGALFAGVAVGNELALRDRPAANASRFGPTDLDREPIDCAAPIRSGRAARLAGRYVGTIDRRPIGSVELSGIRADEDMRWLAYVATTAELGQYGSARSGERTWVRTPQGGWQTAEPGAVAAATVDRQAVDIALTAGNRAAAEDYGIEVIEGARARRCRIGVDGTTFRTAFPEVRWLVGSADLSRWRGQVDYWIFLDGEIGQIAGTANGEAHAISVDALQATLEVRLTATERDRDIVVYPPAP
ncbi:MAG: hypothetical protein ACSLFN_12560 [Candidatus Limnocylindrales bacterium]